MSKAFISSNEDDFVIRAKFLEILNDQDSINVTLRMVADFCIKLSNNDLARSLFLEALNKEHNILRESYSFENTSNSIFAKICLIFIGILIFLTKINLICY